jgi:uncharacterized protein
MSPAVSEAAAHSIGEYAAASGLERLSVVLHGGEPLLIGADRLVAIASAVRDAAPGHCVVDVSMQTNGTRLTAAALETLSAADIGVSISVDGPPCANDLHRLDRRGRSTADAVEAALRRLRDRPEIFAGTISVIDPRVHARTLFEYLSRWNPPRVDVLLPDANRVTSPLPAPALADWLVEAFDVWVSEFPHLRIRTFEALLDALVGLESGTDGFGLGDVSLLTVETDGGWHDLDVFKVSFNGRTDLGATVFDTSVEEVLKHPSIAEHRHLLTLEGLSAACRGCSVVSACGGGAVPHRWNGHSFENPSAHCDALLALFTHARQWLGTTTGFAYRREQPVLSRKQIRSYSAIAGSRDTLVMLTGSWRAAASIEFGNALAVAAASEPQLAREVDTISARGRHSMAAMAIMPSVVAWSRVMNVHAAGGQVCALDGQPLEPDPMYVLQLRSVDAIGKVPRVHRDDPWLRIPFRNRVVFVDEAAAGPARCLASDALSLIEDLLPGAAQEIAQLSPEIQFISDPTSDADKIVSFSDNAVPGALYVSPWCAGSLIDRVDLADSILHEHRHQKLYLLQRAVRLVEDDTQLVASPWRDDLRPPSGLLHAAFVFVCLRAFWSRVASDPRLASERATNFLAIHEPRLSDAFRTLHGCALTVAGRDLVSALEGEASSDPK